MNTISNTQRVLNIQIPTVDVIDRLQQIWIDSCTCAQNIYDALLQRGPRIDVPTFHTNSRLMQAIRSLELEGEEFVNEIQRIVAYLCLAIMGEDENEERYMLSGVIQQQLN